VLGAVAQAAPAVLALLASLAALTLLAGCAALGEPGRPGAGQDGRPRYDLIITGNESVGSGRLLDVAQEDLLAFERRGLRKSSIDDAAYTIENFYLERGHPFARVGYAFTPVLSGPEGETPARVELTVEEGPRTVLDELVLEGNTAFSDEDLAGLQAAPRSGLLETGPPYYVAGRVEAQVAAIASL
jgi:outer membrane protein assembly factor BamA